MYADAENAAVSFSALSHPASGPLTVGFPGRSRGSPQKRERHLCFVQITIIPSKSSIVHGTWWPKAFEKSATTRIVLLASVGSA